MIRSVLLLSFFWVFTVAYSQQADPVHSPLWTKEGLLKKSRTQRAIGWSMAATGAPVVAGSIYLLAALEGRDIDKEKVALALAGSSAYTLVGVSLILTGRKNKKKALRLSLKQQDSWIPVSIGRSFRSQPAIGFQLHW